GGVPISRAGAGGAGARAMKNHGPQPASMRAAPAFRERLSDVEAATPAVSAGLVGNFTAGRTHRRPGKALAAARHKSGSVPAAIARRRCASMGLGVV
ncbi:hypothetical protein, partial [Klebsiella pneumoniae]|uniref:hypothetical protein n=9 Tax=Klebsiella/Raoultella group TaxID=2890311 RepID=UPI00235FAB82